jgi:hypothetical protein
MKKTLLLSVVASTMIMAGGDIAPVEPVVEAPVVSGWEFAGQGVVYYQTDDAAGGLSGLVGGGSLFDQDNSGADAGIQLSATNKDVIAGIGAGFTVDGLSTLNLENGVVSNVAQGTGNLTGDNDIDDVTDGGWIAEAYLTYGFGKTGIKAGRQTLPSSLSPFAYSENWNVFANTFDGVAVVNNDIANTTLVGAWLYGGNYNAYGVQNNMTDFNSLNENDGVWMLTAQNTSFENVTLTGSYYFGSGHIFGEDSNILWGDIAFGMAGIDLGIQGGTWMNDTFNNDMTAFGVKAGYDFGMINASAAYANVNDGGVGMAQLGGTTSVLYTDLLSDQLFGSAVRYDLDKFIVKGNMDALGGNISAAYGYSDMNTFDTQLNEVDLAYSVNITNSLNLTATYAYISFDDIVNGNIGGQDVSVNFDDTNLIRLVARYNF